MNRSDINLCPFFRMLEYTCKHETEHTKKGTYFESFCSLDDFIYSTIRIRNEKTASNSEINSLRKKTFEKCSLYCPKMWNFEFEPDQPKEDDNSEMNLYKNSYADYDSNFKSDVMDWYPEILK